jgi:hypothetical protein
MSTSFRFRLFVFLLPFVFLCVVLTLIVQFGGTHIRNTSLIENPRMQRFSISLSSEVTSVSSYTINPEIASTLVYDKFRVTFIFDEPLDYDTKYEIDMSFTDTRNKQNNVQTSFKTNLPTIYYLVRDEFINDAIFRTDIRDSDKKKIYEAESILLYAVGAKSIMALEKRDSAQYLTIVEGNNKGAIQVPDNNTVDAIDGSHSEDAFLITLIDNDSYEKTIWRYTNDNSNFTHLLDGNSKPLIGSDAVYAPDGKSFYYIDPLRNVILNSPDLSQPALSLGNFDNISRIHPNEKGIFGYKQNQYLTILSSDGSENLAPTATQSSFRTTQFSNLSDYAYIKQNLDKDGIRLLQQLYLYRNTTENIITEHPTNERLILELSLSPNDQYLITEESQQPVIFDGLSPNGTAKNVTTYIRSTNSGTILMQFPGFDVKWRL